ncbi:Splicing factor U2AF-associated protein 2 [Colletotrichum sp. SAR 10_86]|nr:Splicing factor U2AF-associated protein 2 [Colletotrichum sp. SAR 10_75]KAI8212992.1 Splicing factor U2AF-associated protein 2 [Colletotrichum sp. SAR 10_76]KAI8229447.1 Splicing factor U2AF-associated protein 2 [Colletotrichum sp. SAR 10_77]KAI8236679.1 Splicing factor U2AF-associated protein 2 [Colletotrichum sp. SAR 10_86]KAJ5006536.1 Splicing factor U2AF-associated protein 2 [Colletotrichum sp. SAR 10_66]
MADQLKDPLPTSIGDFGNDERISFSKLDNKYLAVLDDGTELEFDPATATWAEAADEPLEPLDDDHTAQLADLSRSASASVGPGGSEAQNANSRKRKDSPSGMDDRGGNGGNGNNRPTKKSKPARAPPQPRQNTAVYVTGLPTDATADEVHELFSRKAGVIAEEIDSGRPRIKMYTDESGNFKGDALVVFFKPQSVEMAIMLLDDTDFRFDGPAGQPRMRVQAADSSYKKTQYEDGAGAEGKENGGSSNGQQKRERNDKDRQKIIRKTQKMAAKLADWSDDEPSMMPTETNSKWDKTVVLKHMFTLEELAEDPAALLEIKEDIRDECSKLGTVTNVVLYDEEPDGVVSVKFSKPESAQACIQLMNGRRFDGRVVEASVAMGRETFKQSKQDHASDSD